MSAPAPRTEAELLERSRALAGLTLGMLAERLGTEAPREMRHAKGWSGELIERALGATAGSRPDPDFEAIGVELKTVPVRADGRPTESTFVCVVPLQAGPELTWLQSGVRRKLARVLWIPVEATRALPLAARRIGSPLLWSPSAAEEASLRADWAELMDLVQSGHLHEITARLGTCLQIRPKAASGRALTRGIGADGTSIPTLPRGFYLRASFTGAILSSAFALT